MNIIGKEINPMLLWGKKFCGSYATMSPGATTLILFSVTNNRKFGVFVQIPLLITVISFDFPLLILNIGFSDIWESILTED